MDKKEIFKTVAIGIVGMGVNNVVQNVSDDATPEDSKGLTKVITWIGGAAISYIIVSKVCDFMEPKISAATEYIGQQINRVKEDLK